VQNRTAEPSSDWPAALAPATATVIARSGFAASDKQGSAGPLPAVGTLDPRFDQIICQARPLP
jgi:hypothetical protein